MADKSVRGSRKPLSRERVLKTALALANKEGLVALSMRKLAAKLRVEAMSLYNHVKNKDEILDGLVELVVAEIAVPQKGQPWKTAMRQRARSAHKVLMRHGWATQLFVSRANAGPAMLGYVDATIGCLRNAGFSWQMADQAWNALDSHIYGFTLQKLNFPFEPEQYAQVAESYLPVIPVEDYPYLHGMARQVIAGTHNGIQDFDFGLELILGGLESLLKEK